MNEFHQILQEKKLGRMATPNFNQDRRKAFLMNKTKGNKKTRGITIVKSKS